MCGKSIIFYKASKMGLKFMLVLVQILSILHIGIVFILQCGHAITLHFRFSLISSQQKMGLNWFS